MRTEDARHRGGAVVAWQRVEHPRQAAWTAAGNRWRCQSGDEAQIPQRRRRGGVGEFIARDGVGEHEQGEMVVEDDHLERQPNVTAALVTVPRDLIVDDTVPIDVVWAALDCPSMWASLLLADDREGLLARPAFTGTLSVRSAACHTPPNHCSSNPGDSAAKVGSCSAQRSSWLTTRSSPKHFRPPSSSESGDG